MSYLGSYVKNNGAMRMSLGDTNALLSSGATSVIHDAHNYRGQANPEFWLSYMAGFPTPKPTVSEPFQRWLTELRASGVDPVHRDSRYHLMALTNARVKELAGDREVSNGETLDFSRNGEPYAGGLFDPRTFGAVDSKNVWAHIPLHEPMLNPVMEEPARRLLGLTEEKFRDVLAHKHSLPTGTGPTAIAAALAKIDVDKELKKTEELAVSSRKTARDDANRKLVYLYGLKKTGQSPKDWVLDSVPVLPPGFRPVTSGPGGVVVSDANLLYKDLFDANDALRRLSKETTDTGAEKLNVYDAVKAVMGLGDPVGAKNKERGVKGVLARLLGDTAKHGFYQQKILGSPTNLSGRAQALPNPDMDMDEVGIPEAIAWNVYHPFVVRRMVRQGIPRVEAARMAADKHPRAKRALLDEMADRPILMTRYPALHRHSVMAFNPRLTAGSGVQVNNLVTKPYGGDFDGDAYTLNVPLSDEAVKEAREKLFPSKNLFSPSSMKATTYLPNMEYTGGLHIASTMDENNNPIEFPNLAAAKAALARGEIGLKTRIRILNDSQST
jgi:DNA-directed RNA polymerase beta' subunit